MERVDGAECCSVSRDLSLPALLGGEADITFRGNSKDAGSLRLAADWINKRAEIRHARKAPPQSLIYGATANPLVRRAMLGHVFVHNGRPWVDPGRAVGAGSGDGF